MITTTRILDWLGMILFWISFAYLVGGWKQLWNVLAKRLRGDTSGPSPPMVGQTQHSPPGAPVRRQQQANSEPHHGLDNDNDSLRWLGLWRWRWIFLLPSRLGALAFLVAILIFIIAIIASLQL
jgi:hypothetical protein